jgi:hypothetical protein
VALLDLLAAAHIGAHHVDERGIVVEQLPERSHVVLVPCAGETSGQLSIDLYWIHGDLASRLCYLQGCPHA